jgi:hypothetical protein
VAAAAGQAAQIVGRPQIVCRPLYIPSLKA